MLSWLDRWAHEAPERLAIAEAGEEIRFAGLQAAVDATARELRPGAIVATLLPSGVGFTIAQLAALKAGATFFPLPSDATAAELERAFALARPDLVLVPPEAKAADLDALLPADLPRARVGEPLPHHAAAAPLDAAMVQLTSGSTGHPKGVLLDHAALESGLEAAAPHVARIAGAAVFSPMPQYHAMGGALVLEHLAQGVSVLVARRFVPGEDRRRMREAGVRAIAGPPSYFRLLLRLGMFRGDALPDVRSFLLGSASAEPALLAGLRDAVPEASLHLRYGLSETFGTLTRLDVEAGEALPTPGLVGVPLGAELGPLPAPGEAPGEVRARGACVARAALRPGGERVALVGPEGWLGTGDLGHRDAAGLHLRGRRSDVIKRFGFRIDPLEVEQALLAHESVGEVVVLGLPDALAGAEIVAAVESESLDEAALRAVCRAALGPAKQPQRFVAFERLPRTHSGKPDRAAVRHHLLPETSDER